MVNAPAVEALRAHALWFEPGVDGAQPIVDAIGNARVVLIGEASHGTHQFYRIRADVTAALIEQKGFNLVAAEADWPDAYRANRWVRGRSTDPDATEALGDFTRFPRWMWRNDVVVDFLTRLKRRNETFPTTIEPVSTGWISIAFTPRYRPSCSTSGRWIRKVRCGRAIGMRASIISRMTHRRTGTQRPWDSRSRARTKS